jgi:hypothetical protein
MILYAVQNFSKKSMSGKRRRRRSKKADREFERLEREKAEKESKARSESEKRQETIRVRWGLKEQDLKAKTYKERKLNEQKLKEQKLKKLLNCIKDLAENDELTDELAELVELAGLQDREIEYLTQFRRDWEEIHAHYPEQLENLRIASFRAWWEPLIEKLSAEEKPKKAWERKRQRYKLPGGIGLIEFQFGGKGEAEWRKTLSGGLGEPYKPTCLDDILCGGFGEVKMLPGFAGGPPITIDTRTSMQRLQELFGMHRNRFPKPLPHRRTGREILYGWRAVKKIMNALLSEPLKRETLVRGAPQRRWLSDPDLRARVLSGIAARINSLSVSGDIARRFLQVVRDHLADSAKK